MNPTLCRPDARALAEIEAIGQSVNEPDLHETIQKACHLQQAFFLPLRKAFLF
jgi:hypothetical protein